MANKCCNYTDNTSPTIEQIKAIETTWNKFLNDYFKAVDDKYPSTDLTIISNPVATIIRGADGNSKKNSNGQPMFKVENDDGDMVELAREEVNALRLKSHLHDTDDDEISHNAYYFKGDFEELSKNEFKERIEYDKDFELKIIELEID